MQQPNFTLQEQEQPLDFFNPASRLGHLTVFVSSGETEERSGRFGDQTLVRADYVITFMADGTPHVETDVWVSHTRLFYALTTAAKKAGGTGTVGGYMNQDEDSSAFYLTEPDGETKSQITMLLRDMYTNNALVDSGTPFLSVMPTVADDEAADLNAVSGGTTDAPKNDHTYAIAQ